MGFFDYLLNHVSGVSDYTCPKCGGNMKFADDEVLMCEKCRYSTEVDDYDSDEEYDNLYPTREEVTGEYEEDDEEEHEGLYDDFMPFED